MLRRSKPLALFVVTVSLLVLGACGPAETSPDALRTGDGSPLYGDGVFAASFAHTGPFGWRHFVQVEVEGGLIIDACYGSIDYAGRRLSENEHYREGHRLTSGIDLLALLSRYQNRLIETQRPGFSVPATAVEWAAPYVQLVRAAIACSNRGVVGRRCHRRATKCKFSRNGYGSRIRAVLCSWASRRARLARRIAYGSLRGCGCRRSLRGAALDRDGIGGEASE